MEEYFRLQKKLNEENFVINVEHIDISSSSKSFGFDSTDPKSTIRFTFSLKNVLSRWILKSKFGAQPEEEGKKHLQQDYYILIKLDQFRSGDQGREKARQIIDQKLKGWSMIPQNWRQQWIEMALDKARAVVTFMPTTHDNVSINFNVTTASNRLFDQKKQANLDDMYTKIKNYLKTNPAPCTICLVQFSGPSEPVSTPCGHNFHGDCLKKWVRIKPRCPVCRASIPRTIGFPNSS